MIIAIEGIDGSGKSSLAEGLRLELFQYPPLPEDNPVAKIQGWSVNVVHFPRNSWLAGYMKKMRKHSDSWFYPAACIHIDMAAFDLGNFKTCPTVHSDHYILDRWVGSTQAYQGAMGMPVGIMNTMDKELTRPDLTVFIDIPVDVAISRIDDREINGRASKRDYFEQDDLLYRVNELYQDEVLMKDVFIVDGTKQPSEMVAAVMEEIERRELGVTKSPEFDPYGTVND